jgi:hypothetical protein
MEQTNEHSDAEGSGVSVVHDAQPISLSSEHGSLARHCQTQSHLPASPNAASSGQIIRSLPEETELVHAQPFGDVFGEYELRRLELTQLTEVMVRRLPQFLFRVTSDKSQGSNSPGLYQSGSIKRGLGSANFYSFSKQEVCETLRHHIRNTQTPGHWISFTTSTKKIIKFALDMRTKGQKDILIHIFDTRQLKRAALIVNAHTMVAQYGVELSRAHWLESAIHETSKNEWLVWDELHAAAGTVDLNDLLKLKISKQRDNEKNLLNTMLNLKVIPTKGKRIIELAPKKERYAGRRDKKKDYELTRKSVLASGPLKNPRSRIGKKQDWQKPPQDHRLWADAVRLEDCLHMLKNMDKSFQIPMMVALLSTQVDFVDQSSISEELEKLPKGKS